MSVGNVESNAIVGRKPKFNDPNQKRFFEMHGTFPPIIQPDATPEFLVEEADRITAIANGMGDIAIATQMINEAGFLRDEAIRRGQ